MEDDPNNAINANGLEELSASQKRHRKDKARIERLIRRVDHTIKQKDVHDKFTPRGLQ